jgi:serine/threonine-protein kinase PknG
VSAGTVVSTSAAFVTPTGAGLGGVSTGGGTGTRSRTAGRGGLGANLVAMPPVPLRDPTTAVMADPQVPESQRFCAKCGGPVGRPRKGKPGLVEGFCPKDRAPFSFRPRLRPGELVDNRYEILGALAHGGLGWIYLARDRNISGSGADRWVVLKGLINTGDADAMASAISERRFLVEVDHPNIVKIHDFAQHTDPKTGEVVGYIVMEYVGGRSLKDIVLARTGPDGKRTPLPVDQVLAYGIEILPAIGYLHDRGLLFCDFKPDNVIHAEEQLKLIDLGAVRRMDDHVSALWGTPGYQAPELEKQGASIASDIYTVGRTLAVLSFDFGGFSTRYAASLPDPGDVPLLAQEESYHRLLLRATHTEPLRRFGSAGDFAEQSLGVLREILAASDGLPRPASSARFTPERATFGAGVAVDGPTVAIRLPLPLVDPADPAAGLLATLGGFDAAATVATLEAAPVRTVEVSLRLALALIEAGDTDGARAALGSVPADWRRDWYRGLLALAAGEPDEASTAFDAVYGALPGEPAARLALAVARELSGDGDGAARRYARVWCVDHSFVSAAFGLARTLLAAGDRSGAVAVLDEVPEVSSQYVPAQIAAVRATLDRGPGALVESDLVGASERLGRLRLDKARQATLVVEMLHEALRWLAPDTAAPNNAAPNNAAPVAVVPPAPLRPWAQVLREWRAAGSPGPAVAPEFLGEALREHEVRLGLERAYRILASLESDPQARYALVDQANAVRPQTVL